VISLFSNTVHESDGSTVRLAPVYDLLYTMALELTDGAGQPMRADTHLGQRVGGYPRSDCGQSLRRSGYLGHPATAGISRGGCDAGQCDQCGAADVWRRPGSIR